MFKQLKDNERGVVFVTVLMIIIVMIVLAISILSMNISQIKSTEAEIKRIQAEAIAYGALARVFANQFTTSAGNYFEYNVIINTTFFNVVANIGGAGPLGTNVLLINVTY